MNSELDRVRNEIRNKRHVIKKEPKKSYSKHINKFLILILITITTLIVLKNYIKMFLEVLFLLMI